MATSIARSSNVTRVDAARLHLLQEFGKGDRLRRQARA